VTGGDDLGTIRALVCEDEPLAVRAIREYLRDVGWIEVVGEARNGGDALRLIHKLEPDLVFMDVRMPGMSGVEVLEAVENRPAVVFTTAFDEYAIPAFDLGAVDYLVKPFGKDRLLETLGRVRVRLVGERRAAVGAGREPGRGERPFARRLFARHKGATVPVAVADVVRVDAMAGGVHLVTAQGTFALEGSLGELQARLDPGDFVRVHRAHLVNLSHVVSIRRYDERRLSVRLDDGSTLVASRRGSQTLREMGV
jgi:two-component system LytT family response regulator